MNPRYERTESREAPAKKLGGLVHCTRKETVTTIVRPKGTTTTVKVEDTNHQGPIYYLLSLLVFIGASVALVMHTTPDLHYPLIIAVALPCAILVLAAAKICDEASAALVIFFLILAGVYAYMLGFRPIELSKPVPEAPAATTGKVRP